MSHLPLCYTHIKCAASMLLRRMGLAIEAGMHMSTQQGMPKRQHVHNLLLVRAKPMYGYHPGDKLFIKVVL